MIRPLTARQLETLDVICRGWISGRMPTFRAIGKAMGIRSTNGVFDHLAALERRKLVAKVASTKQSTMILPMGWLVWMKGVPMLADVSSEEEATKLAYAFAAEVCLGAKLDAMLGEEQVDAVA